MKVNEQELLQRGSIKNANEHGLVVVVDGVELYVTTRISYSGCECCGDTTYLALSGYNRRTEDRIEDHGEADPLDIE